MFRGRNKAMFDEQCKQMLAYVMMDWTLTKTFKLTGIAHPGCLYHHNRLPSVDDVYFNPGDTVIVKQTAVYALKPDKEWVWLFSVPQALTYCADKVKRGDKVPTDAECEQRLAELVALHQASKADPQGDK